MQVISLDFKGYTWERFMWQVAYQKGILLVYRGKLDAEGFAMMQEILYVDYTTICDLYYSAIIDSIKERMAREEMLFFSIAEVDGHVANDVKAMLVHSVKPVFNEMVEVNADLIVESRGSCDLVPNVIKHPKSK